MSAVAFWFLPDTPTKARFLSDEEKEVSLARGVRQVGEDLPMRLGNIVWKDVFISVIDPKVSEIPTEHPSSTKG